VNRLSLISLCTLAVSAVAMAPATAQEPPKGPSIATYPDQGQDYGKVWNFQSYAGDPYLGFEVPETDDRLWTFSCEERPKGGKYIASFFLVDAPEMRPGDKFGMSIRVDNGKSIGMLARMDKIQLEGDFYHMPRVQLLKNHPLFAALSAGNRAYINVNGNKFSVHLKGSGAAFEKMLSACK